MTKKIYLIILAIFSIFINQYFAYRGVFPIDSFVVFNSGYNVFTGNHPFKDYWLITGPFLDYSQSFFFLIFGVNWFGFAIHASVLNMIFALFSFHFFLNTGLKNFYALIYSIGVAVLAYPQIGVPFMDHHAVIFSIMSFYSLSLGILLKRNLYWFLIPIFLIFSFFSKQIPSAYIVILFTIIIFYYFYFTKNLNNTNFIYLIAGGIFSLLLVFTVFFLNGIPIENFLIQYVYYPLSLGEGRIYELNINFNNLINQFKFIYLSLIPLLISSFFLIKIKKSLMQKKELLVSILFISSVAIFIYCQMITMNQVLIFSLVPISAAISHSYSIKYVNKKYFVYFILIIFVFSSIKYHIRFNHNKKFMELADANFDLAQDAGQIDEKFIGLKWITPDYIDEPLKEINLLTDTKKFLSNVEEEKIVITNYQFFSSILENIFPTPNKWYDSLSIPDKENKYYYEHKNFFLSKIKKNGIKYFYFIGNNIHKMYFFVELINNNRECLVSKKINELLVEFDISNCKQVLK